MNLRSQRFLDGIRSKVYICDGAMGTILHSKGIAANSCLEELNLSRPSLVQEVHNSYLAAGANILKTNTFGANNVRLSRHGLSGRCREINLAGAHLARECAGEAALVAGAIGPLGPAANSQEPMRSGNVQTVFAVQAQALADGGVEILMLETFYDLQEIGLAMAAVREVCDLPVVAQVTTGADGNMPCGTAPEEFTRKLMEWGADAVGCNCSVGPEAMVSTIRRMASVSDRPLTAQPSAGLPVDRDGQLTYPCSPDEMASFAREMIRSGAVLVGGCCGTTPEHIRAIREVVDVLREFPSRRFASAAESKPGIAFL